MVLHQNFAENVDRVGAVGEDDIESAGAAVGRVGAWGPFGSDGDLVGSGDLVGCGDLVGDGVLD